MLLGATQFFHSPHCNAIIFRESYSQLRDPDGLITVAEEWFEQDPRVEYNRQRSIFTSQEGGTIQFAYLSNMADARRWRGSGRTFIGFDEASEIPSDAMDYVAAWLRRLEHVEIPLQIRYASNPGGVSHHWLKERFVDAPNTRSRVFLPATVDDNPHADPEEYRANLADRSPITARQIGYGDWDVQFATGFLA